jgi:hypothetical protein
MVSIAVAVFGGWQVAGITSLQSGEAVTGVLSSDLSNTGSFSYRPDQIANPNDFSFKTGSQATDFGCTNPDIRRWTAGTTRQHSQCLLSRPDSNRPIASGTPGLEIFAALTW